MRDMRDTPTISRETSTIMRDFLRISQSKRTYNKSDKLEQITENIHEGMIEKENEHNEKTARKSERSTESSDDKKDKIKSDVNDKNDRNERFFERSDSNHRHGSKYDRNDRNDRSDKNMINDRQDRNDRHDRTDRSLDGGLDRNIGKNMKRMILVTVEDNGIGITESARRSLFHPFKQAQRMAGGTGLGLYSLSKRIEALGGCYGVSDRSDGAQGSMFWFTFPYRPDATARLGSTSINSVVDSVSSHNFTIEHSAWMLKNTASVLSVDEPPKCDILRKCVLIIDDSLSILKVTSRLLKMKGHTVKTAPNGSVGLKMLKESFARQEFDMILTDLQMPVMDGMECAGRFRLFEEEELKKELFDINIKIKRKRMLIVGMSANSDDVSKKIALDSGMDFFVSKPFSYQDLKPIISGVVV